MLQSANRPLTLEAPPPPLRDSGKALLPPSEFLRFRTVDPSMSQFHTFSWQAPAPTGHDTSLASLAQGLLVLSRGPSRFILMLEGWELSGCIFAAFEEMARAEKPGGNPGAWLKNSDRLTEQAPNPWGRASG